MLDPATGAVLGETRVALPFGYPIGLTRRGNEMIFAQNTWGAALGAMGLFGGSVEQIPMVPSGTSVIPLWCSLHPEYDPVTGVLYIAAREDSFPTCDPALFRLDIQAQQLVRIGPISSLGQADELAVLAIDAAGNALVVRSEPGGHRIYRLDLGSGVASSIGLIVLPGGQFWDLAFLPSGGLYGAFLNNSSPPTTTVYRIDLNAFTAQAITPPLPPSTALAGGYLPSGALYCASKINSLGCSPQLACSGIPSPSLKSGFLLNATEIRNHTVGLLFYSAAGRASIPFQGGTLCVSPPVRRTPAQSSGGAPAPVTDCSGAWSIDFNAFGYGRPALAVPGTTIACQWWGRDAGFPAPFNSTLTDAVSYVVVQ
jgi:hypothetical protein